MKPKKFKPLHSKLITSVILSTLLLAFIAASVSFFTELKHSQTNTEIMMHQLLDTVEVTASIAAYSNNKQIAKEVLEGLLNNSVVHKATIRNISGFNLEKTKQNDGILKKGIAHSLYSPFNEKEVIGQISIQSTTKYNLLAAEHSALTNAITSVCLILVTTLVILWLVQFYFSNPLFFVSNTLHAIKSGEKQRIPVLKQNENDELGQLIVDINNLLSTLDNKFNQEHNLRKKIESIEQQLRHIYDSSSAGLFLLDGNGKLLTYNSKLKEILHVQRLDNESMLQLDSFAEFFNEKAEFQTLFNSTLSSEQLKSYDFSLNQENNSAPIWIHCLISKVYDSTGKIGIEGVLFDVTRRVKIELAMKHDAEHDPLTNLLRRHAIKEVFESFMKSSDQAKASFLVMDLDGFKQANDTYGHLAGDQVLSVTAERLSHCVRSTDLICRLGGDEFLIILLGDDHSPELKSLTATKIILSIQQPISIGQNTTIKIGISIGITDFSLTSQHTFDDMTKDADDAMYRVKRNGKNGYCIKDQEPKKLDSLIE